MAIAGEEEDGQKAFSPQEVMSVISLPLLELELSQFKSFLGRTPSPEPPAPSFQSRSDTSLSLSSSSATVVGE